MCTGIARLGYKVSVLPRTDPRGGTDGPPWPLPTEFRQSRARFDFAVVVSSGFKRGYASFCEGSPVPLATA